MPVVERERFLQGFRDEGHRLGLTAPAGTKTTSDFFMKPLGQMVQRLIGMDGNSRAYSAETQRLEMMARSAFIDGAVVALRKSAAGPRPGSRLAELHARIAAREAHRVSAKSVKGASPEPMPADQPPEDPSSPRESPQRSAMQRYRDAKDAEVADEIERLRWTNADVVQRQVDQTLQEEREALDGERRKLDAEREGLLAERQEVEHLHVEATRLFEEVNILRTSVRQVTEDAVSTARQLVASVLKKQEVVVIADSHRRWPRPQPQPYGVSHDGAESLARDWLRFLGVEDAETTRRSGDGGVDVAASTHLAQVKNYTGSVGVEAIRQLAGVAMVERKRAVFLTSGTYTREAVLFAARAEMALFTYDASRGVILPMTREAELMLNAADPEGLARDAAVAEAEALVMELDDLLPEERAERVC